MFKFDSGYSSPWKKQLPRKWHILNDCKQVLKFYQIWAWVDNKCNDKLHHRHNYDYGGWHMTIRLNKLIRADLVFHFIWQYWNCHKTWRVVYTYSRKSYLSMVLFTTSGITSGGWGGVQFAQDTCHREIFADYPGK